MNTEIAAKLLEENLHTIFSWSYSRLYNKTDAEDLTQDIICAVLKSVPHLKNDDAFYGFLWKAAENVLHARLRKQRRGTIQFDETFCGVSWNSPEEDLIQSEQVQLLRRELALLSGQYREVTVRYYIHGKRCQEIASELNISLEMVKYYLFKTRKILKEGIGMTRQYGEKSYDPQMFRMDFWGGGDNSVYWEIFKRKLPGNILLAAYDKPVTIAELSLELGVAAVYLEDELDILLTHDLIRRNGDKVQTNIIIFTGAYEKHLLKMIRPMNLLAAERFHEMLEQMLPELNGLDYFRIAKDENQCKWVFANVALYHALRAVDPAGMNHYPPLSNGSCGFIFGYDNDYVYHHFNGIHAYFENEEKTAWVSIENYRLLEKCQYFKPKDWDSFKALNDAVLCIEADENNDEVVRLLEEGFIRCENGILSPAFTVFTEPVFEALRARLSPIIDMTKDYIESVCKIAVDLLKEYIPAALFDKCDMVSHIHYQMDAMAFIMETMVEMGKLELPTEKVNLCMFGVRK